MKKFTITAHKGQNYRQITVLAKAHRQHIWNESILVGISKAGAARLKKFVAENEGAQITLDVPHNPILIGWE